MVRVTSKSEVAVASVSRRRIALNFLALALAGLVERFIQLFASIYVRRVLAPLVVGQVNWTASILSYFMLAFNPGLNTLAKREVARQPEKSGVYFALLAVVQLIVAIIVCGAAYAIVALSWIDANVGRLLLLQCFVLFLLPLDLAWLLQARDRMTPLAGCSVLLTALQCVAIVTLIKTPDDVTTFVLLPYPFRVITVCYQLWYVTTCGLIEWRAVRVEWRRLGEIARSAVPLGISQATAIVFQSTAVLALGIYHDDRVVGLYSAAHGLYLVPVYLFSWPLLTAFFPSLARSVSAPADAIRLSRELLLLLAWFGGLTGGLCWATGDQIVTLLFGPDFREAGAYFQRLVWVLPLALFNVGYLQPLNAWNRQREAVRCTVAGMAVNLLLNFATVPALGANGAVVAIMFAELATLIGGILCRRSIFPIGWLLPLVKGSFAFCAVASICVVAAHFGANSWGGPLCGVVAGIALSAVVERGTVRDLLRSLLEATVSKSSRQERLMPGAVDCD